jgi:hypothetical protein
MLQTEQRRTILEIHALQRSTRPLDDMLARQSPVVRLLASGPLGFLSGCKVVEMKPTKKTFVEMMSSSRGTSSSSANRLG